MRLDTWLMHSLPVVTHSFITGTKASTHMHYLCSDQGSTPPESSQLPTLPTTLTVMSMALRCVQHECCWLDVLQVW